MIFHQDVQTWSIHLCLIKMWVLKVSPTYRINFDTKSEFLKIESHICTNRVNMAKEVKVHTGPHLCKIYFFSFIAIGKLVLKASSIPHYDFIWALSL